MWERTTKTARQLGVESNEQVAQFVQMKGESLTWYVVGRRCGTRPPCFDGLVQNINAVIALHKELVVNGPLAFLLTGRFNQDGVENLPDRIEVNYIRLYKEQEKLEIIKNVSCIVPVFDMSVSTWCTWTLSAKIMYCIWCVRHNELVVNGPLPFLLTGCFNQDGVENFPDQSEGGQWSRC